MAKHKHTTKKSLSSLLFASLPTPVQNVLHVVIAMRPKQWIKNLFVFAPIIFAGQANDALSFTAVFYAFIAFCLMASSGYLINDLVDIKQDQIHPVKRNRPIASGNVSVILASILSMGLLALAFALALTVSTKMGGVLMLYGIVTFSYTFVFKHMVLLDVFFIAIGFVVRVIAGAIAIGIPASPWIIICTLLLSLFLGVNKRRAELLGNPNQAIQQRKNLAHYSEKLLSEMSSTVTSAFILSYFLYSFFVSTSLAETITPGTPERPLMMLTTPFVIYAIFRYLYLVHTKKYGESPEQVIYTDFPFVLSILLWCLLIVTMIYRPEVLNWIDIF